MRKIINNELPVPPHYDPSSVGKVWKVNYQERANDALRWAEKYSITPSSRDDFTVCLLAVDMQNTFCTPGYELFVGGRSGNGAVEDTGRLCEFIYKNLNVITKIIPTMDTHRSLQIFHPVFLINANGEHPAPYSLISVDDIKVGRWKVNSLVCESLGLDPVYAQKYLLHYATMLREGGKYNLTVWPYHAMLGGIGHALVSPLEEAMFFHGIARISQTDFQIKGNNPITEHYSVLGPEIDTDMNGAEIAAKNSALIESLIKYDAVIIAGEAKSHCVAWTVDDILREFRERDVNLLKKVYLLEDSTSPVVIPGVIDYSEEADKAFKKFSEAGMNIVKSTDVWIDD